MTKRTLPSDGLLHVLVVGQTPPPFGGQAMMIEALLRHEPVRLRFFHVRLQYSADMDSVGRFSIGKVWVLITTILQVWRARFRYRTPLMYYPPSGPNRVPVLRDERGDLTARELARIVGHNVGHNVGRDAGLNQAG